MIKSDGCLIFPFFCTKNDGLLGEIEKERKFFQAFFPNNGNLRDTFASPKPDRSVFVKRAECFLNAGEQVVWILRWKIIKMIPKDMCINVRLDCNGLSYNI